MNFRIIITSSILKALSSLFHRSSLSPLSSPIYFQNFSSLSHFEWPTHSHKPSTPIVVAATQGIVHSLSSPLFYFPLISSPIPPLMNCCFNTRVTPDSFKQMLHVVSGKSLRTQPWFCRSWNQTSQFKDCNPKKIHS